MNSRPKISVVLPIRDAANRIEAEVRQVLNLLADISPHCYELVVVDDGSGDATPDILRRLASPDPHIRIARHGKPRGIEAAGQTGLEKATGEIIFIQEANTPLRTEDLRRLYRLAEDESIVAARAESTPQPACGALLRRLRAWGAASQMAAERVDGGPSSLQMIRRSHLQQLSCRQTRRQPLHSESFTMTSIA